MSQSLDTALDSPATDSDVIEVKAVIENYLHDYWLEGAILGGTVDDAYYVDCTNSSPGINCTVAVALVRPAEFAFIQIAIPYLFGSNREVIFEAIPTISGPGKLILALLMLGIGVFGYRRLI